MLSKERVGQVEARLLVGESIREVSRKLGVPRGIVAVIARHEHIHQQNARGLQTSDEAAYGAFLPSPERIARLCKKFRRENPRRPVGYSKVRAVECAVVSC